MLKEKQIAKGIIQSIDEDGNGIFYSGKDKVLVRHVFAKEEVKVKIVKRIQKGYLAEPLEIIKKNANRVKPACPIFEKCGSCHLLYMNKEAQAAYKKEKLIQLCKQGKLPLKVNEILDMKDPYHYRNKMIIGFQRDRSRKIQAGFYEEFSHCIIPYKKCLLHPGVCDEIIQTIVELMEKLRIEPYEEDKRRGLLRHVLLRYGKLSGQIMVVLVINQNVFPARKNFVDALLKKYPMITTIVQNVNTRKTSVVLGDQERVLYGKGYIEDTLCGSTYRISSKSFYQINHEQTEVLYRTGIEMLKLSGKETVLDAYCGIGTIGMSLAHKVKQVIGVEINRDAVADAKMNAVNNQVKNIRFLCEDASLYMKKAAQRKEHFDIVIMDPPRSGSTEQFLSALVSMRPKQILYISCNPVTQVRDMQYLKKFGYVGSEMQGVDMFPNTNHVETIVLLSKLKSAKK